LELDCGKVGEMITDKYIEITKIIDDDILIQAVERCLVRVSMSDRLGKPYAAKDLSMGVCAYGRTMEDLRRDVKRDIARAYRIYAIKGESSGKSPVAQNIRRIFKHQKRYNFWAFKDRANQIVHGTVFGDRRESVRAMERLSGKDMRSIWGNGYKLVKINMRGTK